MVVNSTTLYLDEWTVDLTADDIPNRSFELSGVTGRITGFLDGTVSFGGYWDSAQSPHSNPPNLNVGQFLVDTYLYVRVTGNRRYYFSSLLCTNVKVTNASEKRVEYSVTAKVNGAWTYAS